jgi:hypothetical protein
MSERRGEMIQRSDSAVEQHHEAEEESRSELRSYLRFGAMIVTAMAVMYALTYVNTFQLAHVRWSEMRAYMVLIMGAAMAVVMLLYMLTMYRNWRINAMILGASVVLFALGVYLVRSETTIQDRSYMSAMIPHHSIAILTSERSEISDVRVCELAVEIIEAQRREIDEMGWLIEDIGRNGLAETAAEAEARPVPDFEGMATRTCATGG